MPFGPERQAPAGSGGRSSRPGRRPGRPAMKPARVMRAWRGSPTSRSAADRPRRRPRRPARSGGRPVTSTRPASHRIFSQVSTASVHRNSRSSSGLSHRAPPVAAPPPARGRGCAGDSRSRSSAPAARRRAGRRPASGRSAPRARADAGPASSPSTTSPDAAAPDQVGGHAVRRHGRQDRPSGGEVLEHLAGQHRVAAAVGVGDQQQQRVGRALGGERVAVGQEAGLLPGVVEPEPARPLAV